MTPEEIDAVGKRSRAQLITAALAAALEGDSGPMLEVTGELDRTVSLLDRLPLTGAIMLHLAKAEGATLKEWSKDSGTSVAVLWSRVAGVLGGGSTRYFGW